ncbi:MAG: O-antigen ligase family protein, partial [Chitinophagales bacterium]|nr:O-antigen ligase family protein [Chitinophagales bacterium]
LVFFIYVVSAINSTTDSAFLNDRIRMKLPFLFLPFAFSVFANNISALQYRLLIFLFMILSFVTAIFITFDFYSDYIDIVNSYNHGHTVETPFSHVRYSLMIAFSIICGAYLFFKRFFLFYHWERWLILAATLFLIFFQHLLAIRSGILALYLCAGWFLLDQGFRKKNLKASLLIGFILLLAPLAAYLLLPSVQMKVNYMRVDLKELLVKGNASYSDGGRILSIQKGLEILKEHPFTGSGIGDLQTEMKVKLENSTENPNDVLLPHNQFVFIAAGTGIFGLLVFIAAVFLPLFSKKHLRNPLFVCFNIILISSFLTEPTIEEQIGTSFYLMFLLLIYVFVLFNDDEGSL